jgi:uncharacterized protein
MSPGAASPYLERHADLDLPWQTFGCAAKAGTDTILLIVGDAASPGCRRLEQQLRQPAVSAFVREHFVPVLVDRHERPDLDERCVRLLRGLGRGVGMPRVVFLTGGCHPFWGGDYTTPGTPPLVTALRHIADLCAQRPTEVTALAAEVRPHLHATGELPEPAPPTDLHEAVVDAAQAAFDPQFGAPPKPGSRPPFGTLAALLHNPDPDALSLATATLDSLSAGGIRDRVDGGFRHSSGDEQWGVGRLDTCGSDNARFIRLYVTAWKRTGADRYREVIEQTLDWAQRRLRSDDGGYAAGLLPGPDHSSLWTRGDLEAALGTPAALTAELLQLGEHPKAPRIDPPLAHHTPDHQARMRAGLDALRGVGRSPARRDDRTLTAHQGRWVSALAQAGAALSNPALTAEAARLMARTLQEGTQRGRVMRLPGMPGLVSDHLALVAGALDLYGATFHPTWLNQAIRLARNTLRLFWDRSTGGLFDVGADCTPPMAPSKHPPAGVEPCPNSTAALCFARLAALYPHGEFARAAAALVARVAPYAAHSPHLLGDAPAAAAWLTSGHTLGIVGDRRDRATKALIAVTRGRFLPCVAVAVQAADAAGPVPWMSQSAPGAPTAQLTLAGAALPPVREPEQLAGLLDAALN